MFAIGLGNNTLRFTWYIHPAEFYCLEQGLLYLTVYLSHQNRPPLGAYVG